MLQNLPENLPYTEHSKLERNRMREIMDYLEHNYMNKIQMKDIAEEIHLCESECSRLFKRYMNVSLFTFLQEYRVNGALNFSSAPMTASWKSPRNPASQTPTTMPRYLQSKGLQPAEIQETKHQKRIIQHTKELNKFLPAVHHQARYVKLLGE